MGTKREKKFKGRSEIEEHDPKCVIKSKGRNITAEEHKRKLTIHNPSGRDVSKIEVDGCLVPKSSGEERCDFMFEIDKPITRVIYLELKGRHTEHAVKQVTATLNKYNNLYEGYKKECHIVASSSPRSSPQLQQLKLKFLKKYKAELFFSTHHKKITI